MIPSALAGQLQRGLADFLRYSFWSSTPGMTHVIDDILDEPGAITKGPYLSVKLPFRTGSATEAFPDVPLGFPAHAHQELAFARLGGRRKQSTLIATGTGSGKTECFLLPVLHYCLAESHSPGVKAILIYPMNALATDQAGRIAERIHASPHLRGKVTAGLYIGESKAKRGTAVTTMGPRQVITDREAMQQSPPDILLTNYKMLDTSCCARRAKASGSTTTAASCATSSSTSCTPSTAPRDRPRLPHSTAQAPPAGRRRLAVLRRHQRHPRFRRFRRRRTGRAAAGLRRGGLR